MPSIGRAIKEFRRRKGLSQQKIEQLTNGQVKAAWIASLETDRLKLLSNDQVQKLEIIASILGVSVLDIYRDAGILELPHPPGTSAEEQEILDEFRRLSPELKQAALSIVRDLRRATRIENGLEQSEEASNEDVAVGRGQDAREASTA